MDINLNDVSGRFTEIVARALDIHDQQIEGTQIMFDHDRWQTRYFGRTELPSTMVEYNRFRPVVDMVVSQLILALDGEAWEKANKPIPGLVKDCGKA